MSHQDVEIGTVKSVDAGKTIVELKPGAVCDSCSARLICRPGKSGAHELPVLNTLGAKPGEVVELAETGNLLLLLSLLQYGLPLLGLLMGVFIVHGINPEPSVIRIELLMAGAGFVGLLLGGGLAYLCIGQISRHIGNIFKITAVRNSRN